MSPQDLAAMALIANKAAGTIQKAYRGHKAKKQAGKQRKAATTKRAGYPTARVGAQSRVFGKKGPKPKRIMGVKWHSDTNYQVEGSKACYFGATYTITRFEMLKHLCMVITQDVAKRSGLVLSAWEALMPNYLQGGSHISDGRLKAIQIRYRREREDTLDEFDSTKHTTTAGETYNAFATTIANQMKTKIMDGYYPFEYQLIEQDAGGVDRAYYIHNRLDEDMVDMYVSMNCKLQNITPASGPADSTTATNIDDIAANPLSGVIYDFQHEAPRLASGYEDAVSQGTGSSFSAISKIGQMGENDEQYYVQALRVNETPANALQRSFQQPPGGAAVFANCIGSKRVSMPPGGFFSVKRNFKVRCSFKRFLAGLYSNKGGVLTEKISRPIVRKGFMIGLEPTVRTTADEVVKLNVNKDTTHVLKMTRAKSPNAPAYVSFYQV